MGGVWLAPLASMSPPESWKEGWGKRSEDPLIQIFRPRPAPGMVSSSYSCLSSSADPDDQYKLTEDTRQLGLVVCRGTSVVLICPQDGMEAIPNPFIQQQEA